MARCRVTGRESDVGAINRVTAKARALRKNCLKSSRSNAKNDTRMGTSGTMEPSSVLTYPPEAATVVAVVVL